VKRRRPDLVFGASGYIGTNLVEFLRAEGRPVRATARIIEVLEGRDWDDVELCAADALDRHSLGPALQDVDTAYYLVHSMAAGSEFPELDTQAARNFAAVAQQQHVRRIVYLGGLTPERPASAHLKSRRETGDVLRQGSVPVTELRAGMIIGPGSAAWEVMRDLVNHLPIMVTPRWVSSKSTPIALENLLRYLAEVPKHKESAGEIYEVAGPDLLTYVEIMQRYAKLVGKRPIIIPVPVLTPRLSSYWLHLVTAVHTNIARALIDGLSQDVVAKDARLAELIPQKLLTVEEAAQDALNADRQHAVPARWVESAAAIRNFRPQYSFYSKQTCAEAASSASAADIWPIVCKVGVQGDFFYGHLPWQLRRAMDWIVGGPSFRRGRRHPAALRVGDVIDAWRVIAIEPQQRLTLLMEMKAPGAGVLEYRIHNSGHERRIAVHGYFHPAGVWGLLYWYATLPVHNMLFRGMAREIGRRAEF
jgi:uncharacterized protein YbjT (DUF2867 family)